MEEIYRNENGSVVITRGSLETEKNKYTFHINRIPRFGCSIDGLKEMNKAINKHLKELENEDNYE